MIDLRRREAQPTRPRRSSGQDGASRSGSASFSGGASYAGSTSYAGSASRPENTQTRQHKGSSRHNSATGATRLPSKSAPLFRIQWSLAWLKPLLLWLIYGSLCSGIIASIVMLDPKTRLEQLMNRPIAGVSVESEFKYIDQPQTQSLVTQHLSPTFLELDMQGLKKALEANPWIDKVIVARTWPDRLLVRIQEQKPIARWGSEGFINMRGEIIRVSNTAHLSQLPLFDCEERYALELMQHYPVIKNIVAANGLTPVRLTLDKTLSWTLEFTPALTIRLGREKTLEKLQNMAKILRTDLTREVTRMSQIDMRYENGFAVT
ncbi:MAG: Cell division protein FtsQ, partial [Pseudomonadota bacterium]